MLTIKELKKYFNGKKVLITGHNGFKGSYMCVLLKYLGAKVYGYSLKPTKNELYDILKKEDKNLVTDEVVGDIRDYKKLKSYIEKVKPTYILHMAAQALVLKSYDTPLYTYDVNVMGTANLMEAIRCVYSKSKNVVSVLNVTTDKVYENKDLKDYAFKELDKLCGLDPYANSKSCSELVTYSYKKSFFYDKNIYRISTARAGNVIGGGDTNQNRIIPDCFRAIKDKKDMLIRNPKSVRPYQFVLEPLIMYLNIMALQLKDKKYEGNYNIGPDKKSCFETIKLTEKFFESYAKVLIENGIEDKDDIVFKICISENKDNKKHEAAFLRLDNSLIKKVFSYKEIYDMDKTLYYTAKVYYNILNKKKISDLIISMF